MRITGGELRGRIIKCPDGIIRPAMDKMRESVFSILGDLSGKSFLDLFSGSGTIAIEACSRGADFIELVEKDGTSSSGHSFYAVISADIYSVSVCPTHGKLHKGRELSVLFTNVYSVQHGACHMMGVSQCAE